METWSGIRAGDAETSPAFFWVADTFSSSGKDLGLVKINIFYILSEIFLRLQKSEQAYLIQPKDEKV